MNLTWNPPGPISAAFLADRSRISGIMGPVGSAKTSTTVMKLLNISAEQAQSPLDGVRYTKWMVIRDSYRNLNRTTLKTFKGWLRGAGHWTGGGSDPATLQLRAKLRDDSIMDMLVEFVALGEHSIEDVARGWEGTGVWHNEGDLLPPEVMQYMATRVGRYPAKIHGGPTWAGILFDYNAPDTENYLYKLFEEECPEGYTLFKQPGGRDPRAENLENLPAGYYDEQVKMLMAQGREDLVRRMVDNLYGYSRDGKPVYPEYRDDFHCSALPLDPVPGLPIKISVDQGLHPAAVLHQTLPNGQRYFLDELYCDTGAQGLAEEVLRMKAARYPAFRLIGGLADLHSDARTPTDASSWLDSLNRFLNLARNERIRTAGTDKPDKLTSGVRVCLTRLVDGGKPGLIISPRCKVARKGFNSAYCYKKKRMSAGNFEDKPVKIFPTSDVMNAIEFACMDDGGYEEIVGRMARAKSWGQGKTFQAKFEVRV